MSFKRGSKYRREDIWSIYRPEKPQPDGGAWFTGYFQIQEANDLVVFMNIGIPGRTDHDYENQYDESTGLISWFARAGHVETPVLKKIIKGELNVQIFARQDNTDTFFTYVGQAIYLSHSNDEYAKTGLGELKRTTRFQFSCKEASAVLSYSTSRDLLASQVKEIGEVSSYAELSSEMGSFAFEKHLEDFLIFNWSNTELGQEYDLYESEIGVSGQQFNTEVGPIDILAIKKDKSELLVIELKKGRTGDQTVGQILRYMGWVRANLASPDQGVVGKIIGLNEDRKLIYAISETPNVDFLRYEVQFRLVK